MGVGRLVVEMVPPDVRPPAVVDVVAGIARIAVVRNHHVQSLSMPSSGANVVRSRTTIDADRI